MDRRVYLFTIISFIVGMVELLIGGILDLIADDLQVTHGQAGILISVFSLIFAIAGPVLIIATSQVERKKLTMMTLIIFFFGNIIAVFSTTYTLLMVSRIVTAASGALLTVLSIVMASRVVERHYVGRAVGIVIMGISGSIVLGLPIGLVIGHQFGWRAPFLFVALLTVLLMLLVHFTMGRITPEKQIPLREQLATLKSNKVLFAHLTTFLFLAGHFTFYAYFTPFINTELGMSGTIVSVIYFIFGAAAVAGGGLAGMLTDRFGSERVVLVVTALFAVSLFVIPFSSAWIPLFIFVVIIWGIMSWGITPPMQNYLIETAPEAAATHQSLNNSALHFGIAFGSFIGSIVIDKMAVTTNAYIGSAIVVLALLAAAFSFTRKKLA